MKPEPAAPLPLLIARLARDGAPVAPLPSPLVRGSVWTLKAAAAAAIVTLLLGVRPHLAVHVFEAPFALAGIFTAALALTAAGSAFRLSVPGTPPSRVVRSMPLAAIVAWAALLWIRMTAIGSPLAVIAATPTHPGCIALIVAVGVVPGIWLFDMLRRAAPLEARWTALYAALGAFACGALGTQFICPIDAPGHLLLWHFFPVLALTSVGVVLGARVLRWRRRTISAGTVSHLR